MNSISPELNTGTVGELLVQMRLLQYDVQAAAPLKDSGNDLIAIRGSAMRALQVKATEGASFRKPNKKWKANKKKKCDIEYHILAAVRLVGDGREIWLDQSEIYLIKKQELVGLPRHFSKIPQLKLSPERIDALFPKDPTA